MRSFPAGLLPGPFTVAQARAAGVSRQMLRGGRVRSVLPGVYVSAEVEVDLRLRCRAAQLILPAGAAFSGETAVLLRTMPMPLGAADPPLTITVGAPLGGAPGPPPGRTPSGDSDGATERTSGRRAARNQSAPRLPGIVAHRTVWQPGDVVRLDGLPVTSMERTWCDLAASGWQRLDLVAYADAVLKRFESRGLTRLSARVDSWDGQRGVSALREALTLASPRVDSPMETRLRLLLVDAGLPVPDVNVWVHDENGDPVHRPDLSWRRWTYALDYDGVHHLERDADDEVVAGRRANWRRRVDLARVTDLEDVDWKLRVVTAYELLHHPDQLQAAVRRDLRRRGAPV